MNFLVVFFVSAAAFLSLPSGPEAASPEQGLFAATAPSQSEPVACTPAARVFDDIICAEALEQEAPEREEPVPDMMPGAKKLPAPSPQEQLAAERAQLQQMIWQKALRHKFGPEILTPSEEDISTYQAAIKALSQELNQTEQQNLALLKKTLSEKRFAAPYQAQAEEILALLQQSVSFFNKQKEHKAAVPAHLAFVNEEAEKALVKESLIQWRADKALYEEYGGRLAMVRDRPVPLDAYDTFFGLIKEQAALTIADPRYGAAEDYLSAPVAGDGALYLPRDHDFYKNYFTDPLAQVRMGGANKQSEKLKNWLNSLPLADSSQDKSMSSTKTDKGTETAP